MSLKKDKVKVLGEHFDDERIRSFLNIDTTGLNHPDYVILERAYRGMNPENFTTFVGFFVQSGKDINATGPEGKTLLQIVQTHRHGGEYANALTSAGAQ